MKEDLGTERHRGWVIWVSIFAALLVGVGIFFYYNFLRQSQSELIDAIPTDAVFLFEINDNETFAKDISPLQSYFNEMFSMDALAAYETVNGKLPKGRYNVIISGHQSETSIHLLFNTRIEKAAFKHLLRALSIDPANFQSIEQHKVYTYGTNLKSLKFTYYNHILSVSDDIGLLQKAIIQHSHPKNILSNDNFKKLYGLTQKNKKQNWVIINNAAYYDFVGTFFNENFNKTLTHVKAQADWSAYQLRMSQNELFLSGYVTAQSDDFKDFIDKSPKCSIPEIVMPFKTDWYYKIEKDGISGCFFSMTADSTQQYRYLVVKRDTIHDKFAKFTSEKLDEIQNAYPNGIYPCSDTLFKLNNISNVDKSEFKVFTITNGHYVLAQSEEAMTLYLRDLNQNGGIADNRYYKFSKSNIASTNLLEFTYYNPVDRKPILRSMSEKGAAGKLAQRMSIFSISCNNVSADYAMVNVYICF